MTYSEDIPAVDPQFGTNLVVKALAELVTAPAEGSIVIGVHGSWGSGKTTLLNAIERELSSSLGKKGVFVRFNAWKFQDREALWRALILHVLAQIGACGGDTKQIEELQHSLYDAFSAEEKGPWTVNWHQVVVEVINVLLSTVKLDFVAKAIRSSGGLLGRILGGDGKEDKDSELIKGDRVEKLASVLQRKTVERSVLRVESIEQFLTEFQEMIKQLTVGGRRVFVFVDDLDRCLPESALQIFESIKLFMDAPGCAYIVALDRDVVRKGLAIRYSRSGEAAEGQSLIDPDEYLEKTISISYDVPVLSEKDAQEIVDSFHLPVELSDSNKWLIIRGLSTNPRRLKRFMNILAVQLRLKALAEGAAGSDTKSVFSRESNEFGLFLKLQLIAYRYSGVFSAILADPPLLYRLQDMSVSYQQDLKAGKEIEGRATRNRAVSGECAMVHVLTSGEDFWRIMALGPVIPNESKIVESVQQWFRHVARLRKGDCSESELVPD